MNWKNPIRVMAVVGWGLFQGLMLLGWAVLRAGRFVAGLPAPVLFFFAGLWYAVWGFVRRPFPSLDENPLLALMNYHTPNDSGRYPNLVPKEPRAVSKSTQADLSA